MGYACRTRAEKIMPLLTNTDEKIALRRIVKTLT
jgi:hypothetical protein